MTRKCTQKKDEIVNILADEFNRVKNDLDTSIPNSEQYQINYGRYLAMIDLLSKIKIYED